MIANFDVVRWHHYIPSTFNCKDHANQEPTICIFCQKPIEHAIALTIEYENSGNLHEVHTECYRKNI